MFSLFHVLVIGTYINYPHLTTETHLPHLLLSGVSHPWPAGRMHPRMAMNAAPHKIINLLKTFLFFLLISFFSVCVFNVWPKTHLLPVWPRDAKMLDTPVSTSYIPHILHFNPHSNPYPHCIPHPYSISVFVLSCFYNRVSQTEGLINKEKYFSQFWKL